jgi:hypothetical protein
VGWRERETEAVATLAACRAALAAGGRTVIGEATGAPDGTVAEWQHYPAGDAYDPTSHAQYFYHCHPESGLSGSVGVAEHGHFHLFLRGEGMPSGVAPLVLPEAAVAHPRLPRQSVPLKHGSRDEVCHLIAIAVDARGEPVRLFTTNRWVTGETWYRADDVIRMLDRFHIGGSIPSPLLNRWISALVRIFQPEIAVLLRQRDARIAAARWKWPRLDAFENAKVEITSHIDIDLDARLAAITRQLDPQPPAEAARRAPLPLRLADGWGA